MSQGRRVFDRFETVLPVTVQLANSGAPTGAVADAVSIDNSVVVTGNTINISLGGMLLAVNEPVPFGANVKVRVTLPALKEQSELPATVRWSKAGSIGVQFGSLRAKEVWALNQLFSRSPKASDADLAKS